MAVGNNDNVILRGSSAVQQVELVCFYNRSRACETMGWSVLEEYR